MTQDRHQNHRCCTEYLAPQESNRRRRHPPPAPFPTAAKARTELELILGNVRDPSHLARIPRTVNNAATEGATF